ncbi:MAG TPA: hypothetical protein VFF68_11635 [Anaerolineaceae bacterium]|nr:hypothetical protein [Anaerolineaceae bacterium]
MYLVLFVLHNPDVLDDILTAWDETGVSGVTILPSTGLARFRARPGLREDLPLIPTLSDFQEHVENLNRTLFTIVEDEAMVDRVVAATESVIGNLNLPNTGILSVLPITRVYGLHRIDNPRHEDTHG